MKIAILGSGGREHSIASQIIKSKKISDVYCVPGNGGTSSFCKNINIDLDNFGKIYKFIKEKEINLVIVGPEKPLVNGIVDYLQKRKVLVFGPSKFASKLEGSKIFTKKLCKKYKIPSANFEVFFSKKKTLLFLKKNNFPVVIKADGLASGKGVYICKNFNESEKAVHEIFTGKFGKTNKILVEEFINGEEMSYFIISDGKNYKLFNTAQDHKKVGEGDKGKNTGGMGAYSPSSLISPNLNKKILKKIIEPTLKALNKRKQKYVGFLYAGLMIKNNEPYLIEYNVRMGDPECQTILPLLKSDLLELIIACCKSKLKKINIKWKYKKSLCVVLCSKGYPEKFKNNLKICKINKLKSKKNNLIFHAGTKVKQDTVYSNGGRVLNFVSIGNNFFNSRKQSIAGIKRINWKNGFYRSDIGYKTIDR